MLSALIKAIEQLPQRGVRGAVGWSIGGTLAASIALTAGVAWVLRRTTVFETAWLDRVVDIVGGLAGAALVIVLFPAVVVLVAGFLLDGVCRAVEGRHYGHLGPAREQPILAGVWNALVFTAVVIAVNVLALPLYLLPGPNIIVFGAVNGYLLGREFFEVVAARRMSTAAAKALRRRHRGRVFAAGVVIAAISAVPVVNLVLPVVATAFMVHVFHGLENTGK